MPERRHSLTPLESELRAAPDVEPAKPGFTTRIRRRLHRDPPTTVAGIVLRALSHLALGVAVASAIALVVDHFLHRKTALGFYIVGGALLAVAFGTSTGLGRAGTWQSGYYGIETQARRLNIGVPYVVAGAIVLAIGVAIEAASG